MKHIKVLLGTITITCGLAVPAKCQSFLTNGLVAYYPFNGNANDAAGTNNGTVSGAVLITDRFGLTDRAYSFDGVSGRIVANDAPELAFNSQTSFSVFAWIQFNGNVHGFSGIVSKMYNDGDPTSSSGYQIGIIDNKLQAQIGTAPAVTFQGTNALNDGRWHAIGLILQRTNSTAQLFVDGNLDGSVTHSNLLQNLTCTNFLFFGVERNLSIFFPGGIDDVRIYNRALAASEVHDLYFAEAGPFVDLAKAVRPSFSNLTISTNYQLQVSTDLNGWTNTGLPFTATSTNMVYPQYFEVANWNQLFFRLQVAP